MLDTRINYHEAFIFGLICGFVYLILVVAFDPALIPRQ